MTQQIFWSNAYPMRLVQRQLRRNREGRKQVQGTNQEREIELPGSAGDNHEVKHLLAVIGACELPSNIDEILG